MRSNFPSSLNISGSTSSLKDSQSPAKNLGNSLHKNSFLLPPMPGLGRFFGYIEQGVRHSNVFQHLFVVVIKPNCK